MSRYLLLVILCLVFVESVAIGLPKYTGGEPSFWKDRVCLLARVETISHIDWTKWRCVWRPLASVYGNAELANELLKTARYETEVDIDPGSKFREPSAIKKVPERNSWVVIVVRRYKGIDSPLIEISYLEFMPDKCGMVSVKSDPLEFLQRLRKAILEAPPTKEDEPPPGNPPYPPR
ncbi:MAG: hypothetical protein WC740_02995 [Verrucomicrobiia bacterium]